MQQGELACVEMRSDHPCDRPENFSRDNDVERDGQKETGVKREGEG